MRLCDDCSEILSDLCEVEVGDLEIVALKVLGGPCSQRIDTGDKSFDAMQRFPFGSMISSVNCSENRRPTKPGRSKSLKLANTYSASISGATPKPRPWGTRTS